MTRFHVRVLGTLGMTLMLVAVLAGSAAAQDRGRAEANQLHAAIANGDVEALEYWLDVRHADPAAASEEEPAVTPIARCLALAGRVLDGRPSSANSATPQVGLRALQDMVAILDAHGAKLSDGERARFSAPVVRWYDDAVTRPGTPQKAVPTAAPTPGPSAPGTTAAPSPASATPASPPSSPPIIDIARRETTVVVKPDPKRTCNGSGHVVFLVNNALLPITASVTTHTEPAGGTKPRTSTYALEQGATWQLGCDTAANGGHVRYELEDWKY